MTGWRAKLGFMVPAGTPTVEREMVALAPRGVSTHYARLYGRGADGTLTGIEGRIQKQIEHLPETAEAVAAVKPAVIALAHTATSYVMGRDGERAMKARIEAETGVPFTSAFHSAVTAFKRLGVKRIAIGTPYDEDFTRRGKLGLESYGFEVVAFDWLRNVRSIFDETEERVYRLGRAVDTGAAQAVFLSGVGMPTLGVLQALEDDLDKPVISSASASMWNALRIAGVSSRIDGYGRLLRDV